MLKERRVEAPALIIGFENRAMFEMGILLFHLSNQIRARTLKEVCECKRSFKMMSLKGCRD